ncbi:MAG: NAD(P)-binding protein, partial [Flavobacteriales bacterium]
MVVQTCRGIFQRRAKDGSPAWNGGIPRAGRASVNHLRRMKVAVIGGGAAGFFAAIHAAQHHPDAEVVLYEKSDKVLAKARI